MSRMLVLPELVQKEVSQDHACGNVDPDDYMLQLKKHMLQ